MRPTNTYLSIVAEKLKCISDIRNIFQLIDFEKNENTELAIHLHQLEVLKTKLAVLEAQLTMLAPEYKQ